MRILLLVCSWDNAGYDAGCPANDGGGPCLNWLNESRGFPLDLWVTHYDQLTFQVPPNYTATRLQWMAQQNKSYWW